MTAETASKATAAPRAEYEQRLTLRQATVTRYLRQERAVSNWRLIIFALGLATAWMIWGARLLSPWWLIVPVAAFLMLAARHDRFIRARQRAERAAAHYKNGIARIEGRWQDRGVTGQRFADPKHPFSGDLDLFGRGSLYELLCTARTEAGEETLAAWLKAPASPEVINARQEAVRELITRLDLREDLAMLGERVRSAVPVEALQTWGAEPEVFPDRRPRLIGLALTVAVLCGLIAWAAGAGITPLLIALAVQQGYAATLRRRVRAVLRAVDRPAQDLETLAMLLARLEREPGDAPLLRDLRAAFDLSGVPPSARLARLQRMVELLEITRNPALAPLGAILFWTPQCALAIDVWHTANGPLLAQWLRAAGEYEALCALSGYAYENPEDTFPEIEAEGRVLEAGGLAHPLLPRAGAIRNDLRLGDDLRILIVSGSNMSGKSTLMRALGVNVALALAGAPVRARRMRLTPLNMGASIRTQDSLQEGISRFYAEILRLRQVVDLARGERPLLFLLDEILHGTNSHDRCVGAEAVIRALAALGAIGLVTTHDLALARIADDPELRAVNVHFEDQIADGKMSFDYRLREGVVTRSNAIALMRAVGLDV